MIEIQYEAKVVRVPYDTDESPRRLERLERQLNELGGDGWYPSGSVGDILILSRLVSGPGPAVRGVLTVTGGTMPGQLTVDQDGNAVVGFVDNFNNQTGLPAGDGSGLTMSVTGDDNGSLVTPGSYSEGTDSVTGEPVAVVALAPVGPTGVSNLTAVLANVSGAPLTEADGVTAFPAIAPFALTLVAGPAAAGELSVDAAPGV